MITFASICSGIEAASAAWEPLGWRCLWLAEIDKAASGVLAYRYPHIPNLGDLITLPARMATGGMPPPDILIGGTPCQAFSIAGLRGGMDDPRGALTMAFVRLADAIDERRRAMGLPPVIIVWENVPGVLNHKDNPFGCFLAALAGEDMPLVASGKRWTNAGLVSGPQRTIGWRILDAQYFGLAQRRRRLFVVASAGARFDPGTILFESQGVRRDIAPCTGGGNQGGDYLVTHLSVRRLLPVECERLQGFADGWTERGANAKVQADGPRYKQLGNSMPVPVIRWLGRRIAACL